MSSYTQRITLNKPALLVALLLLTTLVMFSSGLQAQDPLLPVASPESVGMNSERLARFDTLAAEYVNSGRTAGVVALVVRDGKIVHETVQGVQKNFGVRVKTICAKPKVYFYSDPKHPLGTEKFRAQVDTLTA